MQYSAFFGMALSLVSVANAAPIDKRTTLTGTNAGSLYSFDIAATARQVFYQYGSCGLSTYFVGVVPDSMPLVAMTSTVMQNYGASQHNTLCGKIITMTNSNGVTQQAAIADTNVSVDNSVDMTIDLWTKFGQPSTDASIIPSLSWSINTDAASPGTSTGTCKSSYTVVSGDYCYLIWTEYGITEAQLRSWNPTLNSACDLVPDQVLCVSE